MEKTTTQTDEQLRHFEDLLRKDNYGGELSFTLASKILYSTDASIYQVEPSGVAFPRNQDDLSIIVQAAHETQLPVTARGSGSSLAGQAIGANLIVDCSRYLTNIIRIDLERNLAVVEPGVILTRLNKAIGRYNLQFGPDPASADRATVGGCIANNATGAHSIVYGMTADHLEAADVILSDGSQAAFGIMSLEQAEHKAFGNGVLSELVSTVLRIRQVYADEIKARWPDTWRRVSGYNLNYLLPWSSSQPPFWSESSKNWMITQSDMLPYPPVDPGTLNLAHLLAGSEGTLAIIRQAILRLVPKPKHTILVVKAFPSIADACDHVPDLLEAHPSAVELIPRSLIQLARSVPAYSPLLTFVSQLPGAGEDPAALLVIEFNGEDLTFLRDKVSPFRSESYIAETDAAQKQVWAVRKVGLGILMSRQGNLKPTAFIEDMAVPVRHLGAFVREMELILADHGTQADYYAHASAGCLHMRPILNLKDTSGVRHLRSISEKAVALALSFQGSISAEHGDGMARSEWISQAYGPVIVQAFNELKNAADPNGLLNPGKITQPQQMDNRLRYGKDYQANSWVPIFGYGASGRKTKEGLAEAIEHCNGAGVCRKSDGLMCPSFQVSQDEMHSTRGRANLLRAMISGHIPVADQSTKLVKTALDYCLACKGCKAECPSGVDIAKLKYEFLEMYYSQPGNHHEWRDYLFGYIHFFGKLGYPFRTIVNLLFKSSTISGMMDHFLGISDKRQLPIYTKQSLGNAWKKNKQIDLEKAEKVFFLSDSFTEYFHADTGLAALYLLQQAGCEVVILPVLGAGRTLISKGFLSAARSHAQRVVNVINELDPAGKCPVLSVEPSEIYSLRDEYIDLFPGDPSVLAVSRRSWMVDEFLLRPDSEGMLRLKKIKIQTSYLGSKVLLHSHCYQKAQPPAADGYPNGSMATVKFLQAFNVPVELVDAGCCGMAGAFGYEKEHFDFSQKVGELALFPSIRAAKTSDKNTIVAVNGVSCHTQVEDATGWTPIHPVQIVASLL